jgi:hypothetical protein
LGAVRYTVGTDTGTCGCIKFKCLHLLFSVCPPPPRLLLFVRSKASDTPEPSEIQGMLLSMEGVEAAAAEEEEEEEEALGEAGKTCPQTNEESAK